MNFAVVIPYFQRTSGVLGRALRSVLEQDLSPDDRVRVIVVDDGSPVPPDAEIDEYIWDHPFSASIVSRPNGGPAEARNTGLEHLPADAEGVAFLDSDDCWTSEHLKRAKKALASGADFYFDDHIGLGARLTHFQNLAQEAGENVEGLPQALVSSASTSGIEPSRAGNNLWEFRPGQAGHTFARAYVAHTSTIVVSRNLAKERFEPRLRRAGEDYLYAFQLVRIGARTAYSPLLGCQQGAGINFYGSAVASGGTPYLELLRDNVLCLMMMRNTVRAGSPVASTLKSRIAERGADLLVYWLRLLFTRGHAPVAPLAAVAERDPMLLIKAMGTAMCRGLLKLVPA